MMTNTIPFHMPRTVAALIASGLLGLAGLLLPAGVSVGHASAPKCYPDWSQASEIVSREQLAPISVLTGAAKSAAQAEIVRTVLCRISGAYVYRVVLKDDTGRLRTETVNARRPFGVAGKPD
jgi:hypothetical protein